MYEYAKIFRAFEKGLLNYGARIMPREDIQAELDKYESFKNRSLSDNQYFDIIVFVVFYSGFKAATVTSRTDIIRKYFPSWEIVSEYTDDNIHQMLHDPEMIRSRAKIKACITNAKKIGELVKQYGSVKQYIDCFDALSSSENLIRLKRDLQNRFAYLGDVTTYHFMTDIGMPVLKPDLVICRLFTRLGLIDNRSKIQQAVTHGIRFAEATGLPIRYIDIVLVSYGQVQSMELGIDKGICLESPRCNLCEVRPYCKYYMQGS